MSSSFLEQHLALVKGVNDKSIKLNKKKNRKSIVEQVSRDMKLQSDKRSQLLHALAKPQQRKHSINEIKKVISINRQAQKAPRRKLKETVTTLQSQHRAAKEAKEAKRRQL